jgi:cell division septal protein FtsQ
MLPWFKRKKRNRRFGEREHALDVKLRTSQARAARLRIFGLGASFVFSVIVIGFVMWRGGEWLLDCLIYKNEAFSIQQIDVQTDGVLTADAIRHWAMVRTGENLMGLDLMRVKHDLEMQPPIQFVAVERDLPHTLKLIVNEREPVAQTIVQQAGPGGVMEQAIYDFDADGYAMVPLDPRWRSSPPPASEKLPILIGVSASDVQLGRQTDSMQIRAALHLLSEFDHSPMTGLAELQRVNVAVPEILQINTSQGAEITFSLSQFDMQLRRWRIIYDQYQKWGKAIVSLDLSIANNLPVRWVAAGGVPALPAKTSTPSRIRRKHV